MFLLLLIPVGSMHMRFDLAASARRTAARESDSETPNVACLAAACSFTSPDAALELAIVVLDADRKRSRVMRRRKKEIVV